MTVRKGLLGIAGIGLSLVLCACGGGSGGDDDNSLVFRGNLSAADDLTEFDSLARTALPGIQVCALGECGLTDDDGFFLFGVNSAAFDGGDVLFSFFGNGLDGQSTVVPGIEDDSDDVEVEFLQAPDGRVVLLSISQTDDDLEDIGEEIEDELDSAEDSIEEETDSAGDSIEEELDSAEDSIEEETDSAGDSIDEELDSAGDSINEELDEL